MQDETEYRSDVFTFKGLYGYVMFFFFAILALVVWGINTWLGRSTPDCFEVLTPYMWPLAGIFTALGFIFYYRLRGKIYINKKKDGAFSAEVNFPGKEPVIVDPVSDIQFYYNLRGADHGTNALDRYAVFHNKHNIPVFKILLSGRTFGSMGIAGYKDLRGLVPGGQVFNGSSEGIRKFWVKNTQP